MSKVASIVTSKKFLITIGAIALYVGLSILLLGGYHVGAHKSFSPINEFDLTHPAWGLPRWKFGGIDLSISKSVLYLLTAMLLCTGFAVYQARRMQPKPGRRQTFVETMYDFAFSNVAKSGLTDRTFSRYAPYIASLFVFLWVANIISFLPLPFNSEMIEFHGHNTHIPVFGLYAAFSNINVTLVLTLVTIVFMHIEGFKAHGLVGWPKAWAPDVGEGTAAFILKWFVVWPIEALGMLLRIISLSVRLFANMLAGHTLILMFLALPAITGVAVLGPFTLLPAVAFFLFEVGLVASLQAYIFAMLSGIYIGGAAEQSH